MSRSPGGFIVAALSIVLACTANISAQQDSPKSLWEDFNHYVRIARPDLAQSAGAALLATVETEALLDVVEASRHKDYQHTLVLASKIDTLKDLAKEFGERIQQARIARARDPKRIKQDIALLSQGARARMNATQRLRAAGQWAAPALLATLQDETQKKLHPYVQAAMVQVGRSLVYPLSVAISELEPVTQGQIAQVLAEIGYPRALPYIKLVLEAETTDADARLKSESAYVHLAQTAGAPPNADAAELFLTLSQNHYSASTVGDHLPGFAHGDEKGIIWVYIKGTGLVSIPVPARIFGDVLAMRAAKQALLLDPQKDSALSLWLMSNLRRENLLGDQTDQSYPEGLLEPMFYLTAAGPLRQHDVLEQALDDRDTVLALDAIEALAATAGTDALVNREGTVQPILRSIAYPDRRVRFEAAIALTNARPEAEFVGSEGVVPVLAEALRQTSARHAVVIADNQDTLNRNVAMLQDLGFETVGGLSLVKISEAITGKPGIDLLLLNMPLEKVQNVLRQRVTDYKLSAVPVIVLSAPNDLPSLHASFQELDGHYAVADTDSAAALRPVVDDTSTAFAGNPISKDEARNYATTAVNLLREIALGSTHVFNIFDALPALIAALNDQREDIVFGASQVLAMVQTPEGQRAIADAALDGSRSSGLRIGLLNSLANSANHIGSQLNEPQLDRLLDLIKDSEGDIAIAAARAHGALTLPTSNIVDMLVK